MNIKISSDSTADLSSELIEKYHVTILPLGVILEGKPYIDGVDITPDDIFNHVNSGGNICTTSAVSIADYSSHFEKYLKTHDAVIHITISSDMSACYQNAVIAAAEFENVYVIDSRNLSTGIAQIVIDAAIMASQGMDAIDIKTALDEKQKKLDVSFVIDTLTYLKKGGRCSALAAFGANMLSLKPCIEVKKGKMGVGKKYRGSLEKCMIKYVEDRLKGAGNVNYERIFITDSGVSPELYEAVYKAVSECGPFKEIIHTRAGCTISTHCGPNCLGILFYRTEEIV